MKTICLEITNFWFQLTYKLTKKPKTKLKEKQKKKEKKKKNKTIKMSRPWIEHGTSRSSVLRSPSWAIETMQMKLWNWYKWIIFQCDHSFVRAVVATTFSKTVFAAIFHSSFSEREFFFFSVFYFSLLFSHLFSLRFFSHFLLLFFFSQFIVHYLITTSIYLSYLFTFKLAKPTLRNLCQTRIKISFVEVVCEEHIRLCSRSER